jgi:hypothetical protein
VICPVRLGNSLIRIVTGSKGIYHGRAKIIMSTAGLFLDWRFAVVERLLQASKVFIIVEQRLSCVL